MLMIFGLFVMFFHGPMNSEAHLTSTEEPNTTSKCHLIAYCDVKCFSLDVEELPLHIKTALEKVSCSTIKLHLKFCVFTKNQLEHQWLRKLKPTVFILKLEYSVIHDIQKNAFEGHPFETLKSLIFIDVKFRNLTTVSFSGLNSLIYLTIKEHNTELVLNVQKSALQNLHSLANLRIRGFVIFTAALTNLTGRRAARLPLVTLDLSENYIPEIPDKAFINVPNLATLSLANSGIYVIQKNAFVGCKKIRQLDLRHNSLRILPEGAFVDLISILEGKLYLSNNPWNCQNCSLTWFQEYYIQTANIPKSTPLLCANGMRLDSVDLCEGAEPGDNNSIKTGIVEYENYLSFTCHKLQHPNHRLLPKPDPDTKLFRQEIILQEFGTVNLRYQELQHNPSSILIDSNVNLTDYNLVRFAANNKQEIHCVTNFDNEIVIDQLSADTTYIFLMLHGIEKFPSPRSCFGITTEPEWEERAWLSNAYKVLAITLSIAGAVLIVILSAFITYLYLRRQNHLQTEDSEKIMEPEKIAKTAPISENIYWEPSTLDSLTPYESINKQMYNTPLEDMCRKTSSGSVQVELKIEQLVDDDLELQKKSTNYFMVPDEHKPPLPPPNRRRKSVN